MADPIYLRIAGKKLLAFIVVLAVGHWLLWPDEPVREWLGHNIDWKLKFAFIAWVAVSVGMAYDSLSGLYKAIVADPSRRR